MDTEQIDQMLTRLGNYGTTKEKDSKGRRVGKRVLVWQDLPELAEAMLATGVRTGEVLAISGDDVIKDDDGKTAVRIDAHIVRIKGKGLVRVPGRKSNKPGVILTVPGWSAPCSRAANSPPDLVTRYSPPSKAACSTRPTQAAGSARPSTSPGSLG
jgi:hypothetical protein